MVKFCKLDSLKLHLFKLYQKGLFKICATSVYSQSSFLFSWGNFVTKMIYCFHASFCHRLPALYPAPGSARFCFFLIMKHYYTNFDNK